MNGARQSSSAALPFVRLFDGSPSECLWEDDVGTVHRIPPGDGGEQGNSNQLNVSSLTESVSCRFGTTSTWPFFQPKLVLRTRAATIIHAGIRVHTGQTKNVLETWIGSGIPSHQQGVKIYTPLGHPDFVAAQLQRVSAEHQTLFQRIPSVADVHVADVQ